MHVESFKVVWQGGHTKISSRIIQTYHSYKHTLFGILLNANLILLIYCDLNIKKITVFLVREILSDFSTLMLNTKVYNELDLKLDVRSWSRNTLNTLKEDIKLRFKLLL